MHSPDGTTSSANDMPRRGSIDRAAPLGMRVGIALAAGILAFLLASAELRAGGPYLYALDFTTHWRAADAMIRGYSPYVVINGFSTLYPFGAGYLYLLPAAVLLMPFGYLGPQMAMPLFEGIAIAVFAFALMRDGLWRLPLLACAPLIYGILAGQTVPLVTAAFLIPGLGWLAPLKHTTGIAGVAFTLSKRYALLAAAVVLATVIVWPWWPAQWWAERHDIIGGPYYHIPLLVAGGFVLPAALVRWRRPEARLLVALACLPQTMYFYDQLPLALVARTYREALYVAAASWVAPIAAILIYGDGPQPREKLFAHNAPIIILCYFIPCLVVALLRPNAGRVPRFIESASRHLPGVLRGRPADYDHAL